MCKPINKIHGLDQFRFTYFTLTTFVLVAVIDIFVSMIRPIINYVNSIGFVIALFMIGYLINPFNQGFIFGYPIVALLILKPSFLKQNFDADFVLLLTFSITYALFYAFDPVQGNQYVVIYLVFPPLFYLLGKFLFEQAKDLNTLFFVLLIIGCVFSLSAMISVLSNVLEKGLGQINRSIPMWWNPDSEGLAATIMGSFFTLNMCLPAVFIQKPKKIGIIPKILMGLVFVLSLVCILRIGTRTQIAISLITLFAALVYIVPRQSLKNNVIMFSIFLISVLFIIRNVSFDLSSDWLASFADRMGKQGGGNYASAGGRTERWAKSIQYLFKKPLGWKISEFGYSHNLWLDVLRVSGAIPFFLLIIYSLKSFFNVRKAVSMNKNAIAFNNQIIVYALAFFMIFMVEPIFEGMFPLFVLFCLFMGIINKYRTMHPQFS